MLAFLDIATWRGAVVLTREVEFVVASRPGFSLAALPERVRDRATLHRLPGVSERISATEVRRAVRSGQRLGDLVDPAVAAYICGAGLVLSRVTISSFASLDVSVIASQEVSER